MTLLAAERLDERADELRAAEAAAQSDDVHALTSMALRVFGPTYGASRTRSSAGVDVLPQPAQVEAPQAEALGAAGAVERPEVARVGERERVRRPVGRRDERGRRLDELDQLVRRDAREIGVDDRDRAFEPGERRGERRPLPAGRIADDARLRPARTPRAHP